MLGLVQHPHEVVVGGHELDERGGVHLLGGCPEHRLRTGQVALRQRHAGACMAHTQVRRHELERVVEGPLGLGVVAGVEYTYPRNWAGLVERGSSRAACSRWLRAASQRPRKASVIPTSRAVRRSLDASASAVLSSVRARR